LTHFIVTFNVKILTLFQLTINGFNDKQHILLEKVLDTLLNIKIDTRKFEIFKESVSCSTISIYSFLTGEFSRSIPDGSRISPPSSLTHMPRTTGMPA
jgi:hypothetical protein